VTTNKKSQYKRQGHGDNNTRAEDGAALIYMGGNMLGKGSLDGAGTEGKAYAIDVMLHIVNAKSLGANSSGQKNTIKKQVDKTRSNEIMEER